MAAKGLFPTPVVPSGQSEPPTPTGNKPVVVKKNPITDAMLQQVEKILQSTPEVLTYSRRSGLQRR